MTTLNVDLTALGGSLDGPLEVVDPATGDVIGGVANAAVEDGIRAIDAADGARTMWAATAPRVRAETLRRAFELITAHTEALAELIVRENGKPLGEARGEVTYSAEFFRWYSEEAVRLLGSFGNAPSRPSRMIVLHQPVGVALLVTPWNLPLAMVARKVAPALAAGATVVLKPATETPLSALALMRILAEAGVPEGVVNLVTTSASGEVVGAMLSDPRVRKLSFTGSTEVGRILMAQAAAHVVNCSLELGGNAPFVVFDDADVEQAVQGAMIAKIRHNGEACTAANRFFVAAPIARLFVSRLAEAMNSLIVGPGMEPGVQIGPLVSEKARDKIEGLVAAATDCGAVVRTGGQRRSGRGWFYEPTLLDAVTPDNPILGEEIFGPVAPIVAFENDDEVTNLANDSEHGLAAYVYTKDIARGLRFAEAVEAGMVGVNEPIISDPAAPFGGVKQSGIGREGGHDGILQFTETKYVAVTW